jgi:hypothetical protein
MTVDVSCEARYEVETSVVDFAVDINGKPNLLFDTLGIGQVGG